MAYRGADSPVESFGAFVLEDDRDAVEDAAVEARRVGFGLELSLELQSAVGYPLSIKFSFHPDSRSRASPGGGRGGVWFGATTDRILTVSKGCVAVTAPQAARPPATKALHRTRSHQHVCSSLGKAGPAYPVVVDIVGG